MRSVKEEPSCGTAIDLISAVKELNGLSPQELVKLIRDSENNTILRLTENGSCIQINVEKLARYLPLHLIAVLMSSELDEASFRYLLCGLRLLHSLCDIASRHAKLEQILLDDVKASEQLLDLIFYLLIILGGYGQGLHASNHIAFLHSALVTCSLYLLTVCISSQWHELAQVLLAHPKVDIFMDVAFAAVRLDIKFLQTMLSAQSTDSGMKSSSTIETLSHLSLHCEASLQFLHSLCQQRSFRERLVKNKELCGKGGILLLAQAIMSLNVKPLFRGSSFVAAVSRLKSKVLSILLHLCEAESVSYLDEVASTPESLDLAKFVALEVLELLKEMFVRDFNEPICCPGKNYPKGLLQLNAMRLTDIFSDDSNFRSYITVYFTEVLAAIFSLPHGEFLSSWCSSELPVWEEDATLEYDSFAASGGVLALFTSSDSTNAMDSEPTFIHPNMARASYAHQRTSLLVKVVANLHCFVPDICKEEKDLFLNKFLQCLQKEVPKFSNGFSSICDADKATVITRNLRSLLSQAESLIPTFLNDDDLQLLRVFFSQLEPLITPVEFELNRLQERKFEGLITWDKLSSFDFSERRQEAQSVGVCSSSLPEKGTSDLNNRNDNLKEGVSENSAFQELDQFFVRSYGIDRVNVVGRQDKKADDGRPGRNCARGLTSIERETQNAETSGSDSSSTQRKNCIDQMDGVEFRKSSEHIKESVLGRVQEDAKVKTVRCEEKQQRKRKRTIMNDRQIALIEKALLDEPEMQRNASSIQSWADKLSSHGSEVTTSQLKNWLNNRKARLARAAKDVLAPSEGDNTDKQSGPGAGAPFDSPESPLEEVYVPTTLRGNSQSGIRETTSATGTNESLGSALRELVDITPAEFVQCEPGQYVVLVDTQGEEIGKGKVYQVHGKWYGRNLEESETCVVDIIELKADRWSRLPHPSEAMGTTFEQAEKKLGVMRVAWDSDKLFMLQPRLKLIPLDV